MHFRFDIDKSVAATAYLIQKAGGRYDVFALIKTLYYADRIALTEYGRTITGDKFVSMDKGPVVSGIYDLIKGKIIPTCPEALPVWQKHISERERHVIHVKKMPEIGFLSVREIEVLDAAFQTISKVPPYWLADWTHKECPEWQDPKGSSRMIDPVSILKAVHKSDEEISAIDEEVSAINAMKDLLR